jgi:hypothetical protein
MWAEKNGARRRREGAEIVSRLILANRHAAGGADSWSRLPRMPSLLVRCADALPSANEVEVIKRQIEEINNFVALRSFLVSVNFHDLDVHDVLIPQECWFERARSLARTHELSACLVRQEIPSYWSFHTGKAEAESGRSAPCPVTEARV